MVDIGSPAADQFPSGFLVLPRLLGGAAVDVTEQAYDLSVTPSILRLVALTGLTVSHIHQIAQHLDRCHLC